MLILFDNGKVGSMVYSTMNAILFKCRYTRERLVLTVADYS